MLVKCNAIDDKCPDRCKHKTPHKPLYDMNYYKDLDRDMEGFCTEGEAECWFMEPYRYSQCVKYEIIPELVVDVPGMYPRPGTWGYQ
jgi:hypothetical protein